MSYFLEYQERVDTGLRRIILERIDTAIRHIDEDTPHEAVHNVRKRCKQLRGALRLLRPAQPKVYKRGNACFRDLARTLSGLRDTEALAECHDALMDALRDEADPARFAHFRRELTLRRDEAATALDLDALLDDARDTLLQARTEFETVPLDGVDMACAIAGLTKTYRRGAKARRKAKDEPTVEGLHEWRKRAKYNRYQFRILHKLWSPVLKPIRNQAKRLSDVLGDHHDLAVLREIIEADSRGFRSEAQKGVYETHIARRSGQLEAEAWALGARLYAMKPKRMAAWLESLSAHWIDGATGPIFRGNADTETAVALVK